MQASTRRATAGLASLAVHFAVLIGLVVGRGQAPVHADPPSLLVSLAPPVFIAAQERAARASGPRPASTPAPASRAAVRAPPSRPAPSPLPAPPAAPLAPDAGPEVLSQAELAGAAGGPAPGASAGARDDFGRPCAMAARLETALQGDRLVKRALAAAPPPATALRLWKGDWVRDPREDGKGLAAVREAVLWTIGFAPAGCRGQLMRGVVVLTVDAGAGPVRLALGLAHGAASWRWSDLLGGR